MSGGFVRPNPGGFHDVWRKISAEHDRAHEQINSPHTYAQALVTLVALLLIVSLPCRALERV